MKVAGFYRGLPKTRISNERRRRKMERWPPLSPRDGYVMVSVTDSSVTEVIVMSKPSDLVQGTLDLLLLKILALEPLHGWAIAQRLSAVSGEELHVSDGSLYPALHKLEQQGWIKAEWKTSELGRRAKFYSLTGSGRRKLEEETEEWRRLSSAISRVVRLKEA